MSELMRVGDRSILPRVDENGDELKPSILETQVEKIFGAHQVVRFNNRAMYIVKTNGFPHFEPLTKERFDNIAYNLIKPMPTRSRVSDMFAGLANMAPDLTGNAHLVLFGQAPDYNASHVLVSPNFDGLPAEVWDTQQLTSVSLEKLGADYCVWRSPYAPIPSKKKLEFIMELAGGDEGLYDDIMQSIAPMIMEKKPDGVIWWIGDGANGKSTLMDALYRIFPGQLASLTVKALADGRDTPNLNGNLANIVKESSEGRIEDTETYKAIGTHENLTVHKFHSQETITVRGNMHHIFSGNSIPVFNDKGYSARRRTFIVPFNQKFDSDPTFEDQLFTPEFFGRLIAEMQKYARQLRKQGYKYKWSAQTLGAKLDYDTEANSAENYARELIREGVVGFNNFGNVRTDYENWCREEGQVALGIQNMRRALMNSGFERKTIRINEHTTKEFRLPTAKEGELQKFSAARPGLYSLPGFRPEPEEPEPGEQLSMDEEKSEW